VPLPAVRGDERHDVCPDGGAADDAPVADPLPVPGLGAGAAPRHGPPRMVPAEPGGRLNQPLVGGGGEGVDRAVVVTEVDRLAPAVHRVAGRPCAGTVACRAVVV